MNALDKKGYRISIEAWVGNLGNHLIQMSGALNVARHTDSVLTTPKHPLLRRRKFDFRNRSNDNCLEPVIGRFFYQKDCYQFPIRYDRDRRRIFQDYVYDDFAGKSRRERFFSPISREQAERIDEKTLVINMRSGSDIFRADPPPQNDYMQPPLSFYKHVIETHGYSDCLIVTESARKNPCIEALLSWRPGIRIKTHTSVVDDIRTLLRATNLVMCHSTFSWCCALMSKELKMLYQPESFQVRGVDDLSVFTYRFDNYIRPGEWKGSAGQLREMVEHSIEDVHLVHKPRGGSGTASEPELSSCW